MYQRILLAVDGSSTSKSALEEGIKFAKDQGAKLRLVHVLDFAPIGWAAEGMSICPPFRTLSAALASKFLTRPPNLPKTQA